MPMELNESKLYKELGLLTKDKGIWKENIPYVSSLLSNESIKIQAKALWLLAEMGLEYPSSVKDAVPQVVSFFDSNEPLLREREMSLSVQRAGIGVLRETWHHGSFQHDP